MTTARAMTLRGRGEFKGTLTSYRAADSLRSRNFNGGINNSYYGGGADRHVDDFSRGVIRESSRAMRRNSHLYAVMMNRWADDLGTPQPRPATSNPEFNAELLRRFKAKALLKRGGFDARGLFNWGGLFRRHALATAEDGDVFVMKLADGNLVTKEAQNINARTWSNGDQMRIGGITLDRAGNPTQIWVCPDNNLSMPDLSLAKSYSPDQIVWYANRDRHTQTRGLPALVAGLDDFERIDSVLESTVISSEQASNLFGAIKRIKAELARGSASPATASPITGNGRAAPLVTGTNPADYTPDFVEVARGQLLMLYDDQEFQSIAAAQPNMNVPPFMIAVLRSLGLGLSYPYEIAFMDMGQLSWSGSKTLITLARTGMARWRTQEFEPGLSDIWQWFVYGEMERDEALAAMAPSDWNLHAWDWPELPWPDPLKEEQRNTLAFANRTDSPQRVIGHDWDVIARENATAEILYDDLMITRIATAQSRIDTEVAKNPNLKGLHWTQVVASAGAKTAPGAFLVGAAANEKVTDEAVPAKSADKPT